MLKDFKKYIEMYMYSNKNSVCLKIKENAKKYALKLQNKKKKNTKILS